MKALALTLLGATSASPGFGGLEGLAVQIVVVLAAAALVLNQFGVLPRGKTAERLSLDLDVAERTIKERDSQLVLKEAENELLRNKPNLDEHARLLAAMTHSFQEHDRRQNIIAERLEEVARAVIPPPPLHRRNEEE